MAPPVPHFLRGFTLYLALARTPHQMHDLSSSHALQDALSPRCLYFGPVRARELEGARVGLDDGAGFCSATGSTAPVGEITEAEASERAKALAKTAKSWVTEGH